MSTNFTNVPFADGEDDGIILKLRDAPSIAFVSTDTIEVEECEMTEYGVMLRRVISGQRYTVFVPYANIATLSQQKTL